MQQFFKNSIKFFIFFKITKWETVSDLKIRLTAIYCVTSLSGMKRKLYNHQLDPQSMELFNLLGRVVT